MEPISAGAGFIISALISAFGPAAIEGAKQLGKKMWDWWQGPKGKSGEPYKFDDEDLKFISQLPPEKRKEAEQLTSTLFQQYQDALKKGFDPEVDKSAFIEAMKMQPQTAEQLGFPQQNPDFINNLLQGTDFGPIKDEVMRQYHQEIIPQTLQGLTSLGQTGRSSAFGAGLGRAAENVATKLGALGAKYGLERANVMGNLGLKQEDLGYKRAGLMHKLNQDKQQQAFRQAESLANLGLQEKQLGLQNRGQQMQHYANLLQQLQPAVMPNQPSAMSQAVGQGLASAGNIAGNYANYLNNKNMMDMMMQAYTFSDFKG